jgi:putative ABC transport system permease protein
LKAASAFLGSNIFQFAKYPISGGRGGRNAEKYENRRNITYAQALRYRSLMEGAAPEICLKTFIFDGQATYNGLRTPPSLNVAGSDQSFLTANSYTLAYGRNLTAEDVDLARHVAVVGKTIEKGLFPQESPIGKVIKINGHPVTIIGVIAEKGTALGQSQDDICVIPITRFFENFGATKRSINIATQSYSQETYNRTCRQGDRRDADRARLEAKPAERLRNLLERLTEERVRLDRRRRASWRIRHQPHRARRRRASAS